MLKETQERGEQRLFDSGGRINPCLRFCTSAMPSGLASVRKEYVDKHWKEIEQIFAERMSEGDVAIGRRLAESFEAERYELNGSVIKWIECRPPKEDIITTDIIVEATIRMLGTGRGAMRTAAIACQWYRIRVEFFRDEEQVTAEYLSEQIYRHDTRTGEMLDEHLIPYYREGNLESRAEKILRKYYPEALTDTISISGGLLAERMKLKIMDIRLTSDESLLGAYFFYNGEVWSYDEKRESYEEIEIAAGTIVIDSEAIGNTPGANVNDTIIHECVHAVEHEPYQSFQHTFEPENASIGYMNQRKSVASKEIRILEWQAREIALRIQMPTKTVKWKTRELIHQYRSMGIREDARIYRPVINGLSTIYQTPKQLTRRRLIDMGHSKVHGVMNFVNGNYVPTFEFEDGACTNKQRFTISIEEAAKEYARNGRFRELIDTGNFIYIDGHFCLDDPRYVEHKADGRANMTEEARQHVEKCCIRFEINYVDRKSHWLENGVLYREAGRPERHLEAEEKSCKQLEEQAKELLREAQQINTIKGTLPMLFCDTLSAHMARLKISVEKLAEDTNLSTRMINDLRNDHEAEPKKRTVILLCLAMHLPPELSHDMLAKAGKAFAATEEDAMFQLILRTMYLRPIKEIDEMLKAVKKKPLMREVVA